MRRETERARFPDGGRGALLYQRPAAHAPVTLIASGRAEMCPLSIPSTMTLSGIMPIRPFCISGVKLSLLSGRINKSRQMKVLTNPAFEGFLIIRRDPREFALSRLSRYAMQTEEAPFFPGLHHQSCPSAERAHFLCAVDVHVAMSRKVDQRHFDMVHKPPCHR